MAVKALDQSRRDRGAAEVDPLKRGEVPSLGLGVERLLDPIHAVGTPRQRSPARRPPGPAG